MVNADRKAPDVALTPGHAELVAGEETVMPIAARKPFCAMTLLILSTGLMAACRLHEKGPVPLATTDVKNLSRDGRIYIGGAPNARRLSSLKNSGVKTVIDLRLDHQVPAHHAASVRQLGLTYVHLPMRSDSMSDQQAESFLDVMRRRDHEPVLIYCASGNRAGAMYGLYLGMRSGCSAAEAMKRARQAGLRNASLAKDVQTYLENHGTP
jgi:uncharacterized protein (TIGR01244 family)